MKTKHFILTFIIAFALGTSYGILIVTRHPSRFFEFDRQTAGHSRTGQMVTTVTTNSYVVGP